MIEAPSLPEPSGFTLRRICFGTAGVAAEDTLPPPGWREDARFFASTYLAGLVFFLLILT